MGNCKDSLTNMSDRELAYEIDSLCMLFLIDWNDETSDMLSLALREGFKRNLKKAGEAFMLAFTKTGGFMYVNDDFPESGEVQLVYNEYDSGTDSMFIEELYYSPLREEYKYVVYDGNKRCSRREECGIETFMIDIQSDDIYDIYVSELDEMCEKALEEMK